jgi:hypothetical protein
MLTIKVGGTQLILTTIIIIGELFSIFNINANVDITIIINSRRKPQPMYKGIIELSSIEGVTFIIKS